MSDSFLSHAVSCSLVDLVDQLVIVQLRDGRKLIGTLISFDQYSNLILHQCIELFICGSIYAESPIGTHIVRGESIVLMGMINNRRMKGMEIKSVDEVKRAIQSSQTTIQEQTTSREEEDYVLY